MGNEINHGYKIGSVVLGSEMNDFSRNWESGFGTSAEHVETTCIETTGFLGTDSYPESPSSDETAKRLGTRLRSYSMKFHEHFEVITHSQKNCLTFVEKRQVFSCKKVYLQRVISVLTKIHKIVSIEPCFRGTS